MKIRGSVMSLSLTFPHPPEDKKKKKEKRKIQEEDEGQGGTKRGAFLYLWYHIIVATEEKREHPLL